MYHLVVFLDLSGSYEILYTGDKFWCSIERSKYYNFCEKCRLSRPDLKIISNDEIL